MKARNDCEFACDCVKRANVVLHVRLCKEIFARKHTATHKPTSAQPTHMCHDDTHTRINRLWSPLAYGLGGNKVVHISRSLSAILKLFGAASIQVRLLFEGGFYAIFEYATPVKAVWCDDIM